MQTVDAQPVLVRGDYAVWDVVDIPVGVVRRGVAMGPETALHDQYLTRILRHDYRDRNHLRGMLFAAVLWRDLQPAQPVPRGRTSMTAEQWGHARGPDGVCAICRADDSMWCDQVVHGVFRDMAKRIPFATTTSAGDGLIYPPMQFLPLPTPFPSRGRYRVLEASCGELIDRRDVSPEAREEWARELRQRVCASAAEAAERERNKVLVDPYFESWE